MRRMSVLLVLILLSAAFLPFTTGQGGENSAVPMSGMERTVPRSEPAICGTGEHYRTASWDFSNTFIFNRWSMVMEDNLAKMMTNLTYTNDSWGQKATMPTDMERSGAAAVYDPVDNIVILHSGYLYKSPMPAANYAMPMLTYDPAANTWTNQGASKLPTAGSAVWDPVDKCMIVFGGYEMIGATNTYHGETWAWYPSNTTWVQLMTAPFVRSGHAAAWDPDNSVMYVFGGKNETAYSNDIWKYSFASNTWTEIIPVGDETPLTRAFASAVWDPTKKEMIVHGGENATITFLSTWNYKPSMNKWIHRTSAPWARSLHSACWDSTNNVMTVFGAGGAQGNNDTWTYDPATDSWGANAFMPATRRSATCGVYDPVRKTMLVFGGRDWNQAYLGETRNFTLGNATKKYYPDGYTVAPILDLGPDFLSLDRIILSDNIPSGTTLGLSMKANNNNISWGGAWINIPNNTRPTVQGRYLQWNVSMTSSADRLSSPELYGVKLEFTLNKRPTCFSGGNVTTYKRSPVMLNGSASDGDGDTLTYRWIKTAGPEGTLDSNSSAQPLYTPIGSGMHEFVLIVNDTFVDSVASNGFVLVLNRGPEANAGQAMTGFKKDTVTLRGTGTDPDGDPLFYNWSQLSGWPVTLNGTQNANMSFVPAKAGMYSFQLKVGDGEAESNFSTVNVTISNRGPAAVLQGGPLNISINGTVNFTAFNSTDPDGNITKYLFDFGDGTNSSWGLLSIASHIYKDAGAYNVTVRVMDDDENVSAPSSPLKVTVTNAVPIINATVMPGRGNTSTGFRFTVGGGSYDPDGTIVSYEWDFGDGSKASGLSNTHNYSKPGNYTINLRATDDKGSFSDFQLAIVVLNQPPLFTTTSPANVLTVTVGASQDFSVLARDPEGSVLTFVWKVDGGAINERSEKYRYKATTEGTHKILVIVTDGEDDLAYEWTVTVNKKTNPTTPAAYDPTGMILVIVVVLVVVGIVAAVMMGRKKRTPPPAVERVQEPGPVAQESPEATRPDYSQEGQKPKKPGEDYIPEAPAFKVEKL
jgi:PKD repeat protein